MKLHIVYTAHQVNIVQQKVLVHLLEIVMLASSVKNQQKQIDQQLLMKFLLVGVNVRLADIAHQQQHILSLAQKERLAHLNN